MLRIRIGLRTLMRNDVRVGLVLTLCRKNLTTRTKGRIISPSIRHVKATTFKKAKINNS